MSARSWRGEGFKKGNATNAASQTYGTTIVYYVPGAGAAQNKIAATARGQGIGTATRHAGR